MENSGYFKGRAKHEKISTRFPGSVETYSDVHLLHYDDVFYAPCTIRVKFFIPQNNSSKAKVGFNFY